jgi:hypothetical protein
VLHARRLFHAFFGLLLLMPAVLMAQQQKTTGTPCSRAATTTVDGRYPPLMPPPFGGEINHSKVTIKLGPEQLTDEDQSHTTSYRQCE